MMMLSAIGRLMRSVEVLLSLGTSNPELWENVPVTKTDRSREQQRKSPDLNKQTCIESQGTGVFFGRTTTD